MATLARPSPFPICYQLTLCKQVKCQLYRNKNESSMTPMLIRPLVLCMSMYSKKQNIWVTLTFPTIMMEWACSSDLFTLRMAEYGCALYCTWLTLLITAMRHTHITYSLHKGLLCLWWEKWAEWHEWGVQQHYGEGSGQNDKSGAYSTFRVIHGHNLLMHCQRWLAK